MEADMRTDAAESNRIKKIRAVVIRESLTGESDKRLTLIAKGIGKVTVFAKGAKNAKSKFLSGSQPFCYCDFVLFCGGDFLSVTQIELIRSFSLSYDTLQKLVYGTYFLELADKFVMPEQEADDIMLLLINALHMLERTENETLISAVFQMKLLELSGMFPDTYACASCGTPGERLHFHISDFSRHSGFLCANCRKSAQAEALHDDTLAALTFIHRAENTKKLFAFKISDAALNQLNAAAEAIIADYLEMSFKCLNIIRET